MIDEPKLDWEPTLTERVIIDAFMETLQDLEDPKAKALCDTMAERAVQKARGGMSRYDAIIEATTEVHAMMYDGKELPPDLQAQANTIRDAVKHLPPEEARRVLNDAYAELLAEQREVEQTVESLWGAIVGVETRRPIHGPEDVVRLFSRKLWKQLIRSGIPSQRGYLRDRRYLFSEEVAVELVGDGKVPEKYKRYMPLLASCMAWKQTKGVYEFEPTLLKELWDSASDDIPITPLYRLPEWCVWVDLRSLNTDVVGCFAFRDVLVNPDGSLEEHLMVSTFSEEGKHGLLTIWLGGIDSTMRWRDVVERFADHDVDDATISVYQHVVSVLLYLCAGEAEVLSTDGRRQTPEWQKKLLPMCRKKGKGPDRVKSADRITSWRCGFTLGKRLQEAKSRSAEDPAHSVRPHIRRAHWHCYWMGSGPDRHLEPRWLSPILVGDKPPEYTTTRVVTRESREYEDR